MSYEIKPDRNQPFLLPPNIDDWVSKDHPVRFVSDFVDALDSDKLGFKTRKSNDGRPNYSSEMLLKVWLYGYYSGVRSVRKLEKACWENIAFMWLTGMNRPDHNTLWRFFKAHSSSIEGVFRKSVKVACKSDMVGMVINAVDGTKICSRASKDSAYHREPLEKLLIKVDEYIKKYRSDLESSVEKEPNGNRMPEELADAQARAAKIREALSDLDETGTNCMNPTEPEARLMKMREGIRLGYNSQVVADAKEGIIVSQDVVNAPNDRRELIPMLSKTEEALGQVAEKNLADKGYYSDEQVGVAEKRGYDVMVGIFKPATKERVSSGFYIDDFKYDEKRDVYICPMGKELVFESLLKSRKKKTAKRVYRCNNFKGCPHRGECSINKKGRTLKIGHYREAVEKHKRKHDDETNKLLFKSRMIIVEPVFAQIKCVNGFRRFTVWGLDGVRTQWALVCTAYNMRKLYNHWRVGECALG